MVNSSYENDKVEDEISQAEHFLKAILGEQAGPLPDPNHTTREYGGHAK